MGESLLKALGVIFDIFMALLYAAMMLIAFSFLVLSLVGPFLANM